MNPLIDSVMQPPPDAALDEHGVMGAMQSLSPDRGVEGINPDSSNMTGVAPDSSGDIFMDSKDIPSWMGANPFKDDNGQQHLTYDPDGNYGLEGLGGQHVFGGPMASEAPTVPGMSAQPSNDADHLRDAILQQALKMQQQQQQYQEGVGKQNEQEDMQGLKLQKPAQGY